MRIVFGEIPLARDTAAIPPRPSARASEAAQILRPRSLSSGATALNRSPITASSITPPSSTIRTPILHLIYLRFLSDLEDAFLALLRQHGLPLPRTNIDRHGDKVDCHWPQCLLTIELLSYRFHATRDGFERDVARRRRSRHVAFTWGDVLERPAPTVAELRQLLSRARSSPTRLDPRA